MWVLLAHLNEPLHCISLVFLAVSRINHTKSTFALGVIIYMFRTIRFPFETWNVMLPITLGVRVNSLSVILNYYITKCGSQTFHSHAKILDILKILALKAHSDTFKTVTILPVLASMDKQASKWWSDSVRIPPG